MSSVRMCDRCGEIFKEGADGSAVGTVTVFRKDERTGQSYPTQQAQDLCPMCGTGDSPRPKLAIASTDDVQRRYEQIKKTIEYGAEDK